MENSIDIELTSGQVSAILTAIEFIITSLTCYCFNFLLKLYISTHSEPQENRNSAKKRYRALKKTYSIVAFLISLWLAITVFLLELNLGVNTKLSSDTIQTQYINMTEPLPNGITHRISLPKNFRLDNDSIDVMSRYPCKNGIAQLPLRTRSSFYSKSNYLTFPNCANDTASKLSTPSMNYSFKKSFIGRYHGLKIKGGIFAIIPNNPGELIQSNKTQARILMEESCLKQNVSYFLWPTIFNRSWDIGSTNSQETSELTLALLCQKFANIVWSSDDYREFVDLFSIHRWVEDLADCLNRTNENRYELEDSIDHECTKRTSNKHFRFKNLTQQIEITNVSTIFITKNRMNYTTGQVCFNTTLKYRFTMIPELVLSLYYKNIETKQPNERERMEREIKERGKKEKEKKEREKKNEKKKKELNNDLEQIFRFGVHGNGQPIVANTYIRLREKNITQILQAFGDRNASEWLESPLLFALPTKIRAIGGSCEKVNSVLGLAAIGYSTTSLWEKFRFNENAQLSQQQLFHSYLLSLTRYHYDYNSFFSKEKDRGESTFHVSKDFTSIKLDVIFYLMLISYIFCIFLIAFTMILYLGRAKQLLRRERIHQTLMKVPIFLADTIGVPCN